MLTKVLFFYVLNIVLGWYPKIKNDIIDLPYYRF